MANFSHSAFGVLLALATTAGLAGCAPAPEVGEERPLLLAVSLPPVATIVERVAGEGIEVFSLIGPGDSPATFQPSDAQVTRLARASHYFSAGVPFENGPWSSAVRSLNSIEVVDLTEVLELRSMESDLEEDLEKAEASWREAQEKGEASREGQKEGETSRDGEKGEVSREASHGEEKGEVSHEASHAGHHHLESAGHDPHFWLAPEALKKVGEAVRAELCLARPAACPGFEERLAELRADLDSLDGEIRSLLADRAGMEFFVFHPSWGYFADTYGLRQVAIEAGGQMASDSELGRLAHRAASSGTRVLFVQPQIGGSAAAAAAEALGLEVAMLDPLEADVFANLRGAAQQIAESHGSSEDE